MEKEDLMRDGGTANLHFSLYITERIPTRAVAACTDVFGI